MSYSDNPYRTSGYTFAAQAAADDRADFITKTYAHLAGAIGAFVLLEAILLNIPGIGGLAMSMMGGYNWLIVLGLFMAVSWIADSWARSAVSPATQYMGLSLYVVAEAVIFLPILFICQQMEATRGVEIIMPAAVGTLVLFTMLTATVFITRKDFSFLRGILVFGGMAAMGLIVCAILFGFNLGAIFTVAMIALACGYILYSTSNVLHHYRIGQHVAASLALFAAVALLFWYVLRLLMALRR